MKRNFIKVATVAFIVMGVICTLSKGNEGFSLFAKAKAVGGGTLKAIKVPCPGGMAYIWGCGVGLTNCTPSGSCSN